MLAESAARPKRGPIQVKGNRTEHSLTAKLNPERERERDREVPSRRQQGASKSFNWLLPKALDLKAHKIERKPHQFHQFSHARELRMQGVAKQSFLPLGVLCYCYCKVILSDASSQLVLTNRPMDCQARVIDVRFQGKPNRIDTRWVWTK
jgi:hypothetical protein